MEVDDLFEHINMLCCIPPAQELSFLEKNLLMCKTESKKWPIRLVPTKHKSSYTVQCMGPNHCGSVYGMDFHPCIAALRSDFIL